LKIKNLGALTQAAVLPESLLHAMLQRLGEMIPVSVAMAVNLKNAVVKIYSVFSSSLPKPQNFSFRVKNTVTSK
jgi:hypothetical protein